MTKKDESSISISFNSGRQSWVKVNGTPLPITNTNIDLPILTEAPVTSVNGQTGDVIVSGGGGSADFEKLSLIIDSENNTVSTAKTVREIIEFYTSGKCFISSVALNSNPQSLMCMQVYYGTLIYLGEGDGYLLTGFTHSPESITRLEFFAADLDSVFTAQMPH